MLIQAMKLILIIALFWGLTSNAITIKAKVVGVTHGDTITVLDASDTQHKMTLSGIDAPEKQQPQ